MNLIIVALLVLVLVLICALANFIVRQQEVVLEPSVQEAEE